MRTSPPPIGYLLKELDQAITAASGKVLKQHGLTRFHWQILNLVKKDSPSLSELFQTMKVFVNEEQLASLLADLMERAWVENIGEGYLMTAAGEVGFGAASRSQEQVRERVMAGVSGEEYQTVLEVLQRMLGNLRE